MAECQLHLVYDLMERSANGSVEAFALGTLYPPKRLSFGRVHTNAAHGGQGRFFSSTGLSPGARNPL